MNERDARGPAGSGGSSCKRMNEDRDALSQRVQQSFLRLSSTAVNLNSVSDKLNTSVANLENGLKKLGLGITSWVSFAESHSPDGSYWYEMVGYAKVNGKWGLAIKTGSGHQAADEDHVELWPFNESPRHLRVDAIKKIPDLIDRLDKDAAAIASEIVKQTEQVELLASAIGEVAAAKTEAKKK